MLKSFLREKHVAFEETLVKEEKYEEFKEKHKVKTFPQL